MYSLELPFTTSELKLETRLPVRKWVWNRLASEISSLSVTLANDLHHRQLDSFVRMFNSSPTEIPMQLPSHVVDFLLVNHEVSNKDIPGLNPFGISSPDFFVITPEGYLIKKSETELDSNMLLSAYIIDQLDSYLLKSSIARNYLLSSSNLHISHGEWPITFNHPYLNRPIHMDGRYNAVQLLSQPGGAALDSARHLAVIAEAATALEAKQIAHIAINMENIEAIRELARSTNSGITLLYPDDHITQVA